MNHVYVFISQGGGGGGGGGGWREKQLVFVSKDIVAFSDDP